jgi:Glycosyltransferase family 9 (heptosyltransferase)
MSLPLAFGTTLHTIPAAPYLKADAGLTSEWQARLPPRTKFRIGIAWSGGADHKDDRNRSIALQKLLPLLTPRAEWVSLQTDIRQSDLAAFQRHGGIAFFGEAMKSFNDTAALTALMDLVISVDTSVAHLAGAMGKPVWILLPWRPDWRWQLGRADSLWYPSARLFRQAERGDWEAVMESLKEPLAALLSGHT